MKTIRSILLLSLVLAGSLAPAADFTSWTRRMPVTFSGYTRPETLSNFPALVILSTNTPGFSYGDFLSGTNSDLRFVEPNETSELNYEIDSWNTNGSSYVWVQVSRLVDSNTMIWAYWGKSGTSAPAYTTNGNAWDSGFKAVWHLAQTNALDSTANTNRGVSYGNTNAAGLIGSAQSFSANSYVQVAHNSTLTVGSPSSCVTLSAWLKSTAGGSLLSKGRPNSGSSHIEYVLSAANTNVSLFRWNQPSGGNTATGYGGVLTDGQWHHVAFVNEGAASHKIYADGVLLTSNATSWTYDDSNTEPLEMGRYKNATYGTSCYTGLLDEVRVEATARSSNWIWACWMNQASNSALSANGAILQGGAPSIHNASGATGITLASACLNGCLISTGSAPTTVSVYWGPSDGGSNAVTWANTNIFTGYQTNGTIFATNVTISVSNLMHYYRFYADNGTGAWAHSSASFLPGAVWVQATTPNTSEKPGYPGVFTISRPDTATNGDLTVNYILSGAAANGVDYAIVGSNVTILAGSSNAAVTISPTLDMRPESAEDVTLTVAPGPYVVGAPSNATIWIQDSLTFTQTVINTWTGVNNWNVSTNWSQGRVPSDGDDVRIASGSVMLTNATPVLYAFTMNGGTLTFSNWDTSLTASNVALNGGTVTHSVETYTNAPWIPDSRVYFRCYNLTVAANGALNTDGRGYAGGIGTRYNGCGPGGGVGYYWSAYGGGGGYGGAGGVAYAAAGGSPYDTVMAPTNPGSGGGYGAGGNGGAGGGAVRIEANNAVTVHGLISARGVAGLGGGSGGSVYIACRTFGGTNGLVSTQGANGAGNGGGGGGGRIAIFVDAAAQNIAPPSEVQFSAGGGMSYYDNGGEGWSGSIYLASSRLLSGRLQGGELIVPGASEFSANSLTISNGLVVMTNNWRSIAVATDFTVANNGGLLFAPTGGVVTVGSNLSVTVATRNFTLCAAPDVALSLSVGGNMSFRSDHQSGTYPTAIGSWSGRTATGAVMWIGGNLTLAGGIFHVYSGPTNAARTNYGTRVTIDGDLSISNTAWLEPHSYSSANGGSVYISAKNLILASTNGGVEAAGLGYPGNGGGQYGSGPGAGKTAGDWYGSGGGYGGKGGGGANNNNPAYTTQEFTGGTNYGSAMSPLQPGSSGGSAWLGGGGLIWLDIAGTATLNGTLRANGGSYYSNCGGGGSGGGIYLKCRRLAGTNAWLLANGGAGFPSGGYLGGGGGGGRIAIWRLFDSSNTNAWQIQVNGGMGAYTNVTWDDGSPGTVYWGQLPFPATVLVLR